MNAHTLLVPGAFPVRSRICCYWRPFRWFVSPDLEFESSNRCPVGQLSYGWSGWLDQRSASPFVILIFLQGHRFVFCLASAWLFSTRCKWCSPCRSEPWAPCYPKTNTAAKRPIQKLQIPVHRFSFIAGRRVWLTASMFVLFWRRGLSDCKWPFLADLKKSTRCEFDSFSTRWSIPGGAQSEKPFGPLSRGVAVVVQKNLGTPFTQMARFSSIAGRRGWSIASTFVLSWWWGVAMLTANDSSAFCSGEGHATSALRRGSECSE